MPSKDYLSVIVILALLVSLCGCTAPEWSDLSGEEELVLKYVCQDGSKVNKLTDCPGYSGESNEKEFKVGFTCLDGSTAQNPQDCPTGKGNYEYSKTQVPGVDPIQTTRDTIEEVLDIDILELKLQRVDHASFQSVDSWDDYTCKLSYKKDPVGLGEMFTAKSRVNWATDIDIGRHDVLVQDLCGGGGGDFSSRNMRLIVTKTEDIADAKKLFEAILEDKRQSKHRFVKKEISERIGDEQLIFQDLSPVITWGGEEDEYHDLLFRRNNIVIFIDSGLIGTMKRDDIVSLAEIIDKRVIESNESNKEDMKQGLAKPQETKTDEEEQQAPETPPAASKPQTGGAEIFKTCTTCHSSGGACSIIESCVYGKTSSVKECRSYKGLEKAVTYMYTRYFEQEDVDKCIQHLAVTYKNPDLCEEIELDKNPCYQEVAVATNNKEICQKMTSGIGLCYSTIAIATNKPEICNEIETVERIKCMNKFIEAEYLWKTCQKEALNTVLLTESCVFGKLKVEWSTDLEENIILCSGIYPDLTRDDCIAIIGLSQKDLSICDKAGKNRMNCYAYMVDLDPSVGLSDCDKLGVDYQWCYMSIAYRDNNVDICEELTEYSKAICIRDTAVHSNNMQLCERLEERNEKHNCANTIYNQKNAAGEEITIEDCDTGSRIIGPRWVDECYFTHAKKNMDLDLCEKSGQYKESCITLVNHALG